MKHTSLPDRLLRTAQKGSPQALLCIFGVGADIDTSGEGGNFETVGLDLIGIIHQRLSFKDYISFEGRPDHMKSLRNDGLSRTGRDVVFVPATPLPSQ